MRQDLFNLTPQDLCALGRIDEAVQAVRHAHPGPEGEARARRMVENEAEAKQNTEDAAAMLERHVGGDAAVRLALRRGSICRVDFRSFRLAVLV